MEPLSLTTVLIGVVSAVGGAGGAWGATRSKVSRNASDIQDLYSYTDAHEKADAVVHGQLLRQLGRIEAMLEQIDKRIK